MERVWWQHLISQTRFNGIDCLTATARTVYFVQCLVQYLLPWPAFYMQVPFDDHLLNFSGSLICMNHAIFMLCAAHGAQEAASWTQRICLVVKEKLSWKRFPKGISYSSPQALRAPKSSSQTVGHWARPEKQVVPSWASRDPTRSLAILMLRKISAGSRWVSYIHLSTFSRFPAWLILVIVLRCRALGSRQLITAVT